MQTVSLIPRLIKQYSRIRELHMNDYNNNNIHLESSQQHPEHLQKSANLNMHKSVLLILFTFVRH